jgi:hypothetical protein
MDPGTNKEFEIFTSTRRESPCNTQLISFLEIRCGALQLLHHTQPPPSTPVSKRQSTRPTNASTYKVGKTKSYSNVATQLQCTMCKESHILFKCGQFLKLQTKQRFDNVNTSRLCFNCLQVNRQNHACSNQTRKTCDKRHHKLLHFESPTQSTDKFATPSQQTTETNSYVNFKGKPQNHVLLATAMVEVREKFDNFIPCRCLLDGGSQNSFITSQCVQRSKLPKKQNHTFIQGINAVNTATHHNVEVQLITMHTKRQSTKNCVVLDHSRAVRPSKKLDTSSWKITTNIKLADRSFNTPGRIYLLLGADTFYSLMKSGQHNREGNFPILQENAIGRIFSEKTPLTTQRGPQQALFVRQSMS